MEDKNDDDDDDESIVKRPISSCSTNSDSTKSINESLMEDDGKYCLNFFMSQMELTPRETSSFYFEVVAWKLYVLFIIFRILSYSVSFDYHEINAARPVH